MRKITSALAGILLCALVIPAQAQTPICFKPTSGSGCTPVSAAAPLPVTSSGGGGGAVTLASGAVASGAYSSGAYAAGALAAGAFAVGAGVDGWDLTQGARADAAWTTGSGSVISLLKAIAAVEIAANRSVNVAQINGITPLMGNGVTGTGSPRVTIASDNTAFPVNAIQSGTWSVNIGTAPTLVVTGPTPDGTAASTNPVLLAGTTDGTATGLVAVPKVTAGGVLSVDGSATTQPVSVATLPLPSGAATSALQSTINTTLGSPLQAGGTVVVSGVATAANQSTMATNQTSGGQKTQVTDSSGNAAVITAASTASPATDRSLSVTLNAGSNGLICSGTAGVPCANVVTVQAPSSNGSFPTGSTPVTTSATGTTGAVTATLAAASAKTTYICGFSITADAVAGLSGNATVTGVITGTMTYIQGVGVAPAVASTNQTFNPCIPGSTTNTALAVVSAAASTGGTTAVNAWGYQQ